MIRALVSGLLVAALAGGAAAWAGHSTAHVLEHRAFETAERDMDRAATLARARLAELRSMGIVPDEASLAASAGPSLVILRLDPSAPRPDDVHELRWIEEPRPGSPCFAVVSRTTPERAGHPPWLFGTAAFAVAGLVLGAVLGRKRTPATAAVLADAAKRVGQGDLDVTLSGADGDGTISAFNRMTRELRDARARATRAERVAAWRETARRVAHEVKNPLTPIRMAIETLRKARARSHPDEPEIFEESTRAVLEEVNRLDKIVSDFGRFAKLPRPRPEDVDLKDLARHVVALASLPADVTATDGAPSTRVDLEVRSDLPRIRADKEQISQVLTNLVHNALDAARSAHDGAGRVRVTLSAHAGRARIEIEDDGPGIASEDREKVLEPYFTTKPTGTGLGLAIVDRIVSEHEGTLEFGRSEALGGARIVVLLRPEGPPESSESSRPSAP